jgi:hypothetical protein
MTQFIHRFHIRGPLVILHEEELDELNNNHHHCIGHLQMRLDA